MDKSKHHHPHAPLRGSEHHAVNLMAKAGYKNIYSVYDDFERDVAKSGDILSMATNRTRIIYYKQHGK